MKSINDKINENDVDKYSVKGVERAFEVLDCFREFGTQISVTEVQEKLKVNSNMAYRLLKTLEKTGYINQDTITNKFYLTLKVLQLSRAALNSLEIRKRAMPYLEQLSTECRSANVILDVLEHGEVISIARIDCEKLPRIFYHLGRTLPIHATAAGKVLVSELYENELDFIKPEKEFDKYTDYTITNFEDFKKELQKVRQEGIAWELQERILGDNAVAAPIRDHSRRIIGSITLAGFEIYISLDELKEASNKLREIANTISHVMGYYAE